MAEISRRRKSDFARPARGTAGARGLADRKTGGKPRETAGLSA